MTGYASIRTNALALLKKKGSQITVKRLPKLRNEITGKLESGAAMSASFQCVALPAGPTAEKVLGSLIGKRTLEFYLAREAGSGGMDPEPGDQIVWGGVTYTLQYVTQYDPDQSGTLFTQAYGQV